MRAMSGKGKILVVDDDRLVLATVAHGLAQAGYDVIDADNGDDAILLARSQRPDLALLDIRMEGKTGFDVAEYLRTHTQTPFMFLSAFNDEATVAKVKELGALAYLVKPLDVGQIVPTVESVFARLGDAPVAASPAASAASAGAAAGAAVDDALGDLVPLAVGVLMHRYSLPRAVALERLRRQALADGRSVEAHALRVVEAVEVLASGEASGR
jgi:response regulator NasT